MRLAAGVLRGMAASAGSGKAFAGSLTRHLDDVPVLLGADRLAAGQPKLRTFHAYRVTAWVPVSTASRRHISRCTDSATRAESPRARVSYHRQRRDVSWASITGKHSHLLFLLVTSAAGQSAGISGGTSCSLTPLSSG
jgi:hypothetical protein